ncbi:PE-PGRS family protein [Streptomyces sp. NBC_00005]|uniref:PE-PGRS family protein n=1 Tax=Streptomyces sp. NBC_00005 TaxID=2903609 RepID=UPI003249344D
MTTGRDELAELLRRAGLEIVGDGRGEAVLPPWAAWREVVAAEAGPTVTVAGDPSAAVNAEWYRLATATGILAADGVFLIDVAEDCARTGRHRSWTRVRLGGDWDLAGVLGTEFVTVAVDGDALVGVTAEEDSVRLVAVDRIRERQEEAARAAVRETPEERAEAWAALLREPGPDARTGEQWAHGLVDNRSTPKDVRSGLLGKSPYFLYRNLPPADVDAVIDHPDWKVRSSAADMQVMTPEQWARLILGEQEERRRWALTLMAGDRRAELAEDVCRRLAADPSARVRAEATRLRGLPASVAAELTTDPEPAVRAMACTAAWPHLDVPAREALLTDSEPKVRKAARHEHHREHPLPLSVFETEDLGTDMLSSHRLERDLAEHLARHGEQPERRALGRSPHLPPDLVALLAQDSDPRVRFAVSVRPDITEEQRTAIPIDFDPGVRHHELDWVLALHDDPDAMRRLAASSHPLVRRSVARARRLPPDVVERLAKDEDRVVHLFLAESCDDAPADVLLGVWQWWTGSLTRPDRPRGHPNFPRAGLLRYAEDPDPRLRQLALDDPESTPGLVERLSRDPDTEVRYRAASDPRLTAASAVRLLDDPVDHIRHRVVRHPDLPAHVLTGLLRNPDTARTAAGHPALPVEVLRWMAGRLS